MLIIHHCPQLVILYNQVRVRLACDNIHKGKKNEKDEGNKKCKKKGGCGDAENGTPDVT